MAESASPRWHLAQYNIARLVAPLDDPQLADFVANLDGINRLADRAPGFVWRHQTEEGNSTAVRVRGDPMIVINFSVWEDADCLREYTYRSDHAEMYRRRREWFDPHAGHYLVLWWVPAGHEPTVEEAEAKLDYLMEHGPTPEAFTFKRRFASPE
jgi:hypothetical protein